MSTTRDDRSLWRRWVDFWLTPADPTALGFIRIATGILVVYTHLAYCLDLQAFFGKHGWYGAEYINKERKEYPWIVSSFTDWEDTHLLGPRVPDYPHRRRAVLDFINSLPKGKAERAAALEFIAQMNKMEQFEAVEGLNLVLNLGESPGEVDRMLAALEKGEPHAVVITADGKRVFTLSRPERSEMPLFPGFLLALSDADRKLAARDVRNLLAALPSNPRDRLYVLNHLMEMDRNYRGKFVEFLTALPEDEAERKRWVDYLAYWNQDINRPFRHGHPIFSPWFHVTDPTEMALVHSLVLLVMVLFTFGVCTRVTSVLTWLAAVGYMHRTQHVLFGMDTMMNILLFYLMVGNSGGALSVDRLVSRYRAARASVRRTGAIDDATRAYLAGPPRSVSAGLAVKLLQVHFCFIYLAAGLSKLKGQTWWNGSAFWDVMVNPEFTLMRYQWFENAMRAVVSVKPVYHSVTILGVWFTLFLEIGAPFLLWTRLRPFIIWLCVLLHAAIGILMGLVLFELFMMVMLLAFIPPRVFREQLRGKPDPKLTLAANTADPPGQRTAAAVAALDVEGQVALAAKKTGPAELRAAGGEPATNGEAVSLLFSKLRLLRPLRFALWVPGVRGLLARRLFPKPAA
jgi:hypothetical protein